MSPRVPSYWGLNRWNQGKLRHLRWSPGDADPGLHSRRTSKPRGAASVSTATRTALRRTLRERQRGCCTGRGGPPLRRRWRRRRPPTRVENGASTSRLSAFLPTDPRGITLSRDSNGRELPFPRPSSTAATAGRQRGQSKGATYRRAAGACADPSPAIRSAIAHDSAENYRFHRGRFCFCLCLLLPRPPATAHARPRDGSAMPPTPPASPLAARLAAACQAAMPPATRGCAATAAPSTVLRRPPRQAAVSAPASSAPAARGPLGSRFPARRPPRRRLPCRHAARTPAAAGGPPTASIHTTLPKHVHFISLALLPTTAAQVQRGHLVYGLPRGTKKRKWKRKNVNGAVPTIPTAEREDYPCGPPGNRSGTLAYPS